MVDALRVAFDGEKASAKVTRWATLHAVEQPLDAQR